MTTYHQLSERQRNILTFMDQYIQEHGFPPTIREIGAATDIDSTSVVNYNLNKLVDAGFLERSAAKSRGLRLIKEIPSSYRRRIKASNTVPKIPMWGQIVAGEPIPIPDTAFPDENDMVEVPKSLLHGIDQHEVFALKVKGYSMMDAMIQDGDMVILRSTNTANDGDMVAVWLDERGETTLKYFYNEGERIRLQPAHPMMDPIYVDASHCQIQGKVLSVLRNLG